MKLLYWPSPKLREVSSKVYELEQAKIAQLIADMKTVMYEHGGAGLSAIQVGVPLRIFVMHQLSRQQVFINPELVSTGGARIPMKEGCLSVPGFSEMIQRWTEVTVNYQDEGLVRHEGEKLEGFAAHVFQHELEHLDGKMYLDHIPKARRSTLLGNMQALKRAGKLR